MKKYLLSATALLFTLSALAQGPATTGAKHDEKTAAKALKHETRTKGEDDQDEKTDKAGAPINHGQTVQAFAQSTPLTGAEKGAAVSALASNGRSAAKGKSATHTARSARGERTHGNRQTGAKHSASGRQAGASHRASH